MEKGRALEDSREVEISREPAISRNPDKPTGLPRVRKVQIAIAIVTLVVLAFVVGIVGGVVGRKAADHKKGNQASVATTTIQIDPSSTVISSSPSPTQTGLTFAPGEGPLLKAYSGANFTGNETILTTPGIYFFNDLVRSYQWQSDYLFYCSVGFCAGNKLVGWRGYETTNRTLVYDSFNVTKVVLLCTTKFIQMPDC